MNDADAPIPLAQACALFPEAKPQLTAKERKRRKQQKYNAKRYLSDPAASKARVTKWAKENPERRKKITDAFRARQPRDYWRWAGIKSKYGITKEQSQEIFAGQGCACAICLTTDPGPHPWHTDHCHKTNKVRGVLCHPCNTMLGRVKDDSQILRAAADYIDRHKGKPND